MQKKKILKSNSAVKRSLTLLNSGSGKSVLISYEISNLPGNLKA